MTPIKKANPAKAAATWKWKYKVKAPYVTAKQKCSRCKKLLPAEKFHSKKSGYCIDCNRKYQRERREKKRNA